MLNNLLTEYLLNLSVYLPVNKPYKLLALLLGLVFILSTKATARPFDEVVESNKLIVAVYENFPPYSFIDEQGNPSGVDVDIARKLAEKFGVELEVYWTESDETLDDDLRNVIWKGHLVSKKKADVLMRVPYDPEFAKRQDISTGELVNELVFFKAPYHNERWLLLTKNSAIPNYQNPAVFIYEKLGVEVDSLPYTFFSYKFGGRIRENLVSYRSIYDALPDLDSGEIAAVVDQASRIQHLLHTHLDDSAYQLHEHESFLLEQASNWNLGVAVHTDSRDLGYSIESKMDEMQANGELETIFLEYGVRYVQPIFDD